MPLYEDMWWLLESESPGQQDRTVRGVTTLLESSDRGGSDPGEDGGSPTQGFKSER